MQYNLFFDASLVDQGGISSGGGPGAYITIAGDNVEAIIDIREQSESKIVKKVKEAGIKIYWSNTIVNTAGYKRFE